MLKIAVTGGAGFIGANLVRRLLGHHEVCEVAVVDDLSTGFRSNLDGLDRVSLHEGSVLDPGLLDTAFDGADAVVHLAAVPSVPRSIVDPLRSHTANVTGTVEVLEAARRAGGLYTIVASSSSVYGANPTLPKSEQLRPEPLSPYAASKLAAESYAIAYQYSYDLPTLTFRFFNVYGPLQAPGHAYAAVLPVFIDSALRGVPLPVDGDGGQTRDFTFVGSVTAVIIDAIMRRVVHPAPVNLAFGSRRSLNEVVAELCRQLDADLAVTNGPTRAGDVRHSQADGRLLGDLFPDVPVTPFEQGLQQTIEWFRARESAHPPTPGDHGQGQKVR